MGMALGAYDIVTRVSSVKEYELGSTRSAKCGYKYVYAQVATGITTAVGDLLYAVSGDRTSVSTAYVANMAVGVAVSVGTAGQYIWVCTHAPSITIKKHSGVTAAGVRVIDSGQAGKAGQPASAAAASTSMVYGRYLSAATTGAATSTAQIGIL